MRSIFYIPSRKKILYQADKKFATEIHLNCLNLRRDLKIPKSNLLGRKNTLYTKSLCNKNWFFYQCTAELFHRSEVHGEVQSKVYWHICNKDYSIWNECATNRIILLKVLKCPFAFSFLQWYFRHTVPRKYRLAFNVKSLTCHVQSRSDNICLRST